MNRGDNDDKLKLINYRLLEAEETINHPWGHEVPYNDYSRYSRQIFGRRVQKLSIAGGFTCPNRDGTRGRGGCTFCNNEAFNPYYCESGDTITRQIDRGIERFDAHYPDQIYLAYFQTYTNTYAPLAQLKASWQEALSHPRVSGLVVGTRPDCLPDELIDYFTSLQHEYHVVVELGIESTREETLIAINRGHTFDETREAIIKLNHAGLPVGGHLILGLPGESRADILEHARVLSSFPLTFLKLHQLQYVRGSKLGHEYLKSPESFKVLQMDEYIDLVIAFLELLPPSIVVERLSSEAPPNLLIAPAWGIKNHVFTHHVIDRMNQLKTWQGRLVAGKPD